MFRKLSTAQPNSTDFQSVLEMLKEENERLRKERDEARFERQRIQGELNGNLEANERLRDELAQAKANCVKECEQLKEKIRACEMEHKLQAKETEIKLRVELSEIQQSLALEKQAKATVEQTLAKTQAKKIELEKKLHAWMSTQQLPTLPPRSPNNTLISRLCCCVATQTDLELFNLSLPALQLQQQSWSVQQVVTKLAIPGLLAMGCGLLLFAISPGNVLEKMLKFQEAHEALTKLFTAVIPLSSYLLLAVSQVPKFW